MATATGRLGDGGDLGEKVDLALGFRKLKLRNVSVEGKVKVRG